MSSSSRHAIPLVAAGVRLAAIEQQQTFQLASRRAVGRRRSARTTAQRHAWTSALKSLNPLASSESPPPPPPLSSSSSESNARSRARDVGADRRANTITDPLQLVGGELKMLRENVRSLLGSGHPALDTIAKYYFQAEGKHVRPLIVMLMSRATNGLAPGFEERRARAYESEAANGYYAGEVDEPLEKAEILNDDNPGMLARARDMLSGAMRRPAPSAQDDELLLPSQRRLAEITEMIHVASLLHDDVIDLAETRRGAPSGPSMFGNKLTVLAGDFLLARASLYLSRLGSNEVVELVASVLANLVEGEVMQMKGNTPVSRSGAPSLSHQRLTPEIFDHYMRKTYLKTASLIAKSTRATTILGGCGERQGWAPGERIKDIAYSYGRNLGIAFQLVDDMLDFTSNSATLGKPGQGADLKLGLATAPALYAWEEFPELGAMIERKFEQEGDVERVRPLGQWRVTLRR